MFQRVGGACTFKEEGMSRMKNHEDRVALISYLENQYSKKLTKLQRNKPSKNKSLPILHGIKIRKGEYLDFEL